MKAGCSLDSEFIAALISIATANTSPPQIHRQRSLMERAIAKNIGANSLDSFQRDIYLFARSKPNAPIHEPAIVRVWPKNLVWEDIPDDSIKPIALKATINGVRARHGQCITNIPVGPIGTQGCECGAVVWQLMGR